MPSIPRKLHIGCFDCPVDGWLNTDITPHLFIARVPMLARLMFQLGKMSRHRFEQHEAGTFTRVQYLNLAKRFPYPDGAFDFVFSSHVFEHISRSRMPGLLSEIQRVLAPGGVMRISVPDLSFFVRNYQPEKADDFVKAVFEIDHANEKNRHHWMYSPETLIQLLQSAEFAAVERKSYREGSCPDLEKLDNRPEHSIFVEATKAAR